MRSGSLNGFPSFPSGIQIRELMLFSLFHTAFHSRVFTIRFVSLPLFQHGKISLWFYFSILIEFEKYYVNRKCSEVWKYKGQSDQVSALLGETVIAALILSEVSRQISSR